MSTRSSLVRLSAYSQEIARALTGNERLQQLDCGFRQRYPMDQFGLHVLGGYRPKESTASQGPIALAWGLL